MKNSRKLIAFLLCIVMLLTTAAIMFSVTSGAASTLSSGISLTGQKTSYSQALKVNGTATGAIFTQKVLNAGTIYTHGSTYNTIVNTVEIPAGNSDITLEAINNGTYTYSKTTVGNAAVAYNTAHPGQTVVAAVNADPWIMYHTDYDGDGNSATGAAVKHVSVSRGLLVIDGEIWATPQCDDENNLARTDNAERGTPAAKQPAFCVLNNNTYVIGAPQVVPFVVNKATGKQIIAAGINRLPAPNSIIFYTNRTGAESAAYSDAYEVYVEFDSSSYELGFYRQVTGKVTYVYPSNYSGTRAAIGANTVVISARGSSIATVQNQFSVGQSVYFDVHVTADHTGHTSANLQGTWGQVREAIGGFFELTKNGTLMGQQNVYSAYPCPFVGIRADGTAVIVSTTASTDGVRAGTSMNDLPALANALGLVNSLMFDGGGSATMVTISGSNYVRRASAADGSPRAVINSLAVVYHGAGITVSNTESSGLKTISSSDSPLPTLPEGGGTGSTTGMLNVSCVDSINGVKQGMVALPGSPVSLAMQGSLDSSYNLALSGWSIVNGGTNGGIHYSVNDGNWVATTPVSYTTAEDGIMSTVQSLAPSFTSTSAANGRFSVKADLSAYQGSTVTVRFATASAVSGDFSHFATITGVKVGSSSSGGTTTSSYVASNVETLNGTTVSGQFQSSSTSVASGALPITLSSTSLVMKGWALVDGGQSNGGIYYKVGSGIWTNAGGTFTAAPADADAIATVASSWGLTNVNTAYSRFEHVTADLSAYAGSTVDVSFGIKNTAGTTITFVTFTGVAVPSTSSGGGETTVTPGTLFTKDTSPSIGDFFNASDAAYNVNASYASGYVTLTGHAAKFSLLGAHQRYVVLTYRTSAGNTGNLRIYNYNSANNNETIYANATVATNGEWVTKLFDMQNAVSAGFFTILANDGVTSGTTDISLVATFSSADDAQAYINSIGSGSSGDSSHTHSYTYTSSTSGTHIKACSCGDSVVENCTASGAWGYDETTHYKSCVYCNTKINSTSAPHSGSAATCISKSVCSTCNQAFGEYGSHTFEERAGKEPTCTESGISAAYYCTSCSKLYDVDMSTEISSQSVIPATGHTYVTTAGKEPTCTTPGLTSGESCMNCGKVLITADVIPATGVHIYGEDGKCTMCGAASVDTCEHEFDDSCDTECDKCGYVREATHPTEFLVTIPGTAATCKEPGVTEGVICVNCGIEVTPQSEIPALGHTEESIPGIAASCATSGYTDGKRCTVCGEITVAQQVIPATGHTLVTVPGKDATCTSTGLTAGEMCTVCGTYTVAQNVIEKTAHDSSVIIPGKAATCTESGLGDGTRCSVCNVITTAQAVIEPLGHAYSETARVEATCESDGGITKTCSRCGDTVTDVIPATGHTPKASDRIDPTCTEVGYTGGVICEVCNTVIEAPGQLPALGHEVESWTIVKEATCTENGSKTGTCKNGCGQTFTETISATGHTSTEIAAVAATCTSKGYTAGEKCSVCNTVLVEPTEIPALEHSFTSYIYNNDGNCTSMGTETAVCDREGCDVTNTRNVEGTPTGHVDANSDLKCDNCGVQLDCVHGTKEKIGAVEPTCTTTGLTEGERCSICKEILTAQSVIPAIGHTLSSHDGQAATCTEAGYEAYQTCSKCDYTTYKAIPALGHAEVSHEAKAPTCTEKGWDAYVTCSRCDYTTYVEKAALGHAEVSHSAKAPTCTESGWSAYVTCSRCDYTTYAAIPATGHTVRIVAGNDPTHNAPGMTNKLECSVCGAVLAESMEIPKLDENKDNLFETVENSTAPAPGVGTAAPSLPESVYVPSIRIYTPAEIKSDSFAQIDIKSNFINAENKLKSAPAIIKVVGSLESAQEELGREGKKIVFGQMFEVFDQNAGVNAYNGGYTITFTGIDTAKFHSMLHYENGQWVVVENVSVDKNAGTVTVTVNSLSPFAATLAEDCAHSEMTLVSATTAATCQSTGLGTYRCEACTYTEERTLPVDPANHVNASAEWVKTATQHTYEYTCCGADVIATENHSWSEGVCTECGYVCVHIDADSNGLCDICGKSSCEHVYTDDTDAVCNKCGYVREIAAQKLVVWSIDTVNGQTIGGINTTGNTKIIDWSKNGISTPYVLTIRGWSIAEGGQTDLLVEFNNDGNRYSLATFLGDAEGPVLSEATKTGIQNAVASKGRINNATVDLSPFNGQTVTIKYYTASGDAVIPILEIRNYKVSADTYRAAIDYVGTSSSDKVLAGGSATHATGAFAYPNTLSSGTVYIGGWLVMRGGQTIPGGAVSGIDYSVNGGATWSNAGLTISGAADNAIYGAASDSISNVNETVNARFAGTLDLYALGYGGRTVTVLFSRVNSNGTRFVFLSVTVNVSGTNLGHPTCDYAAGVATNNDGTHDLICACGLRKTVDCTAGGAYMSDESGHWQNCEVCGGEVLSSKTAHTIVTTDAKEPTCSEVGYTEGKKCSVCEKVLFAAAEIPTTAHTEVIIPAVEATCSSVGYTEGKKCSECGTVTVKPTEIPELGHTDENGDGKCDVCNQEICEHTNKVTIPAVEATCTTAGSTEGLKCSDCGKILTAVTTIPATGHNYGANGTCTNGCGTKYPYVGRVDFINENQYAAPNSVATSTNYLIHTLPGTLPQSAKLMLRGWMIAEEGHEGYYFSVDGGTTWMAVSEVTLEAGLEAHQGVATEGGVTNCGDLSNVRFENMYIDLSPYRGQTKTVTVAFKKGTMYIPFVEVTNVAVPASTGTAYAANVSTIEGNPSFGAVTGSNLSGIIMHTYSTPISGDYRIDIGGWMLIDGGQQHLAWSVNGGATWGQFLTHVPGAGEQAHINAAEEVTGSTGAYTWDVSNATFNIAMDLSQWKGQTITITLARVSASGEVIIFAKLTVTVPGTASHTCTYTTWTNNGNGTHSGFCQTCGVEAATACIAGAGYQSDATGHWQTCGGCAAEIAGSRAGHTEPADKDCTAGISCSVCSYLMSAAKEHTPGAEATCTTAQTCTECGKTVTVALGHNYTSWIEQVDATCTDDGVVAHYGCTRCDLVFDENYTVIANATIPATGHTDPETYDCTAGKYCTVCNALIEAAKASHTWQAATCTTAQVCTVCGTEGEAALGHTEVAIGDAKEATCTTEGMTAGKTCSVCGEILEEQTVIPATGHDELGAKVTVEPGCTTEGTRRIYCTKCDTTHRLETIEATGHTPGAEATCTQAQVCDVCGEVIVEALGHNFTVVIETVEADCTTEGYTNYQCTRCDATQKGDIVAALGHDEVFVQKVEATCHSDGCEAYSYCKREGCGYTTYTDDLIITERPAHAFDNDCGDATCNNAGCTYVRTVFPAEHTEGTKATCVAQATCIVCGQSYGELSTVHVYEHPCGTAVCTLGCGTVRPEAENAAHTYDTDCDAECNICGEIRIDITHTWSEDYMQNEGYHWYACTVCGEKKDYAEHTWTNNCDTECNVCGYTREITHTTEGGQEATCTTLAVCGVCGQSFGTLKDHIAGAEATCTTAQTCVNCDYVFVAALGHSYVAHDGLEATCTTSGHTAYSECSVCSAKQGYDVIEALGHDPRLQAKVDPSCTDVGYEADYLCDRCGKRFSDAECTKEISARVEIAATGHTTVGAEWVVQTKPTCTTDGYKTLSCVVCGTLQDSAVIPANGHTWTGWANTAGKEPTCTQDGEQSRSCTVCGEVETKVISATGHASAEDVEWTVIQAADCTSTGIRVKYCNKCGTEELAREIISELGHTYTVFVETIDATCTTDGYTTYKCERCDETENRDITKALGHTEVIIPAVDATCTTVGNTAGKKCSVCGVILDAPIEIPMTEHNWNEGVVIQEATCTEQGKTLFTCIDCETQEEKTTEAKGHTLTRATSATQHWMTCTVCDGYIEGQADHTFVGGVCTEETCQYVCGHAGGNATCIKLAECIYCGLEYGSYAEHQKTPVSGTPATCTQTGLEAAEQCTVCGQMYDLEGNEIDAQKVIEKLAHIWGIYTPDGNATCTEDGTKTAYCTYGCGNYNTVADVGSATGHTYGEWTTTVPATCTETGTKTRKCINCDDTQTDTIAALGHTEEAVPGTPASCTETGLTAGVKCSVCGEILTAQQEIPATGHGYDGEFVIQTPASCTETGLKVKYCSNNCGEIVEQEVISATGHTASGEWVTEFDATCETPGTKYQLCTVCNQVAQEGTIPATGHNYDAGVIDPAPTCTTQGTKTYTCPNPGCETPTKTEVVAATGHNGKLLEAVAATCTQSGLEAAYECAACGLLFSDANCENQITERTVIPATGHNFEGAEWIVDQAPTCTLTGTKYRECINGCGEREADIVPANGHTLVAHQGVAPTCTETGLEAASKCSVCGKWYNDKSQEFDEQPVIPATGHINEEIIEAVEPTCTATGLTEGVKCADCGTIIVAQQVVDALGHKYDDNFDTECNRCGETRDPICDHEWDGPCDTDCNLGCGTTRAPGACTLTDVAGKDATCEATGLEAAQRCTVCNKLYDINGLPIAEQVVIPALNHADKTHTEGVAPTCTENGFEAYSTCNLCGQKFNAAGEKIAEIVVIDATGHTEVIDPAVEPTCTEEGKTEGKHCSVCNEVIIAQVTIPANGHTRQEIPAKAPTCTEAGNTAGAVCSVCNVTLEAPAVIDALGHSEQTINIPATCTENAKTNVICTTCGTLISSTETPDTAGHIHTVWRIRTQATCEAAGLKYEYCVYCNSETGVTAEIAKLDHDIVSTTVDATCTEAGYTYEYCMRCSYEKTTVINATGHSSELYEIITLAPTCSSTGLKKKVCAVCGEAVEENIVVEKLNHVYSEVVTPATCTEAGYTTYTCACGDTYTGEVVDALGHTWGEYVITIPASCVNNGTKTSTCSACGETRTDTAPATGHDYVSTITRPTCTADGYTTKVCTVCNDTLENQDIVAATGHTGGAWKQVTAPTCTQNATKIEICTVCEDEIGTAVEDEGTMLEHNLITTETESTCTVAGKRTVKCSDCDYKQETTLELAAHVAGGWVVDTEPTCTTEGTKHEVCQVCGNATGNEDKIPTVDHVYNRTVTAPTCTEAGYTTYTCACGDTYTGEVVDALGHTGNKWITDVEATCETAGSKHKTCIICGANTGEVAEIPATGHSYTIKGSVEATCTSGGKVTYACACGEEYSETTDALGHITGSWIVDTEETCISDGSKYQVCAVCNAKIEGSDTVIDEIDGHDYAVSAKVEATCDKNGSVTYKCSRCADTYTDTLEASGHDYATIKLDATCTSDGYTYQVCKICQNTTTTVTITATGHVYGTETVVAPTCTLKGYTTKTCEVCGYTEITDEVLPAHKSVTDARVEPSCSKEGLTEGEHCSVCGYVILAQEVISKTSHTYQNDFDPDCDVCGAERAVGECEHNYGSACTGTTCLNCGHVRVAPGHLEIIVPGYAPTCVDEGVGDGIKCAICNIEIKTGDTIDPLGHTPGEKATCTKNQVCTVCGETLVYASGHGTNGTKLTLITVEKATCTTPGYKKEMCSCGEATGKYEVIPVTKHTAGGEWIVDKEALCSIQGSKHRECTVCGYVIEIQSIPSTGIHTGGKATCQAQAICEVCEIYYGGLGDHVPGDAATCENAQICTVCKEELAGKLAHSYNYNVTVEATCNTVGLESGICAVCGAVDIREIPVNATHHEYGEATCTSPATCKRCGAITGEPANHTGGKATCATLAICEVCGQYYGTVDENAHYYDNNCDASCNGCGAIREGYDHEYVIVPGKEATCTEAGYTDDITCADCDYHKASVVIPAKGHTFVDGECACGTVKCDVHEYDNVCDAICNRCGEIRGVSHYYLSDCDETCESCGAIRELEEGVEHTYDNDCSTVCVECGATRAAGEHVYDENNPCDNTCNNCGYISAERGHTVGTPATCKDPAICKNCGIFFGDKTENHTYSGDCDATCDVCGAKRTISHNYTVSKNNDTFHWNECECGAVDVNSMTPHAYAPCAVECSCGYIREQVEHFYDNSCDTECNLCGATRTEVQHVYTDKCDTTCNNCGESREVEHTYDNDCDSVCNDCGFIREAKHSYSSVCDTVCDACSEQREPLSGHIYSNACDRICNNCGYVNTEAVVHRYEWKNDGVSANSTTHWQVCSICGAIANRGTHYYTDDCVAVECICGYTRDELSVAGKHTYTTGCDRYCDRCGAEREDLKHSYSYECDRYCDWCGYERAESELKHFAQYECGMYCMYCDYRMREEAAHKFAGIACQGMNCSFGCGTTADAVPHSYVECSVKCEYCNGADREVDESLHQRAADCSTACMICGTPITPKTSHKYQYPCSLECLVCHEKRSENDPSVLHKKEWMSVDDQQHRQVCANCNTIFDTSREDHKFRYKDLGDGTHRVYCRYCDYEAIVEHTFTSGKCLCGHTDATATVIKALPATTAVSTRSSDDDGKDKDDSEEE